MIQNETYILGKIPIIIRYCRLNLKFQRSAINVWFSQQSLKNITSTSGKMTFWKSKRYRGDSMLLDENCKKFHQNHSNSINELISQQVDIVVISLWMKETFIVPRHWLSSKSNHNKEEAIGWFKRFNKY